MSEQTYIKNHKYGIEERAKQEYGLTNVFELAGYLLEDGTMLDFSCGGWERSQDHRNIGYFFYKYSRLQCHGKIHEKGQHSMPM